MLDIAGHALAEDRFVETAKVALPPDQKCSPTKSSQFAQSALAADWAPNDSDLAESLLFG
jgi:hypothetical protein